MSVFALIAAIIFFLLGLDVISNTAEVNWVWIGVGFFALHFAFDFVIPRVWDRPSSRA